MKGDDGQGGGGDVEVERARAAVEETGREVAKTAGLEKLMGRPEVVTLLLKGSGAQLQKAKCYHFERGLVKIRVKSSWGQS